MSLFRVLFVRFYDIRAHLLLKSKITSLLTREFELMFLQPISSFLNSDLLLVQVTYLKDEAELSSILKPYGEIYYLQKAARNRFLVRFCDERRPALICNRKGYMEVEQQTKDLTGITKKRVVGTSMSINLNNYHQIYFKMINPFKLKSTVHSEHRTEDKENVQISK